MLVNYLVSILANSFRDSTVLWASSENQKLLLWEMGFSRSYF